MSIVTNWLSRVIRCLRKWMRCTSVDEAGAETLTTNVLPNETLLHIFRFLDYDDLIIAEKVCGRWKTVVEACFAAEKQLSLLFFYKVDSNYSLKRMRRYGSSVKTLKFRWDLKCPSAVNWAEEIADRFPRLITLDLSGIPMSDDDFKYLSAKCCQLTNVTLSACLFTAEGLRIFLQALPGIKVLTITIDYLVRLEVAFEESMPPMAVSAVFYTCRSLHTFQMFGRSEWIDRDCFFNFCKECVSLQKLVIKSSNMPAEMFDQIQHCSLLEKLKLIGCHNVDDSTLIEISKGCPNLRSVTLYNLPLTSDVGLMCFGRCRNLNSFVTDNKKVTDETLFELSNCVNLRKVELHWCPLVSDRGCDALLTHCPQLEVLVLRSCEFVSKATVESAIKAVECRQNGLVLKLMISRKRIDPKRYVNCHPLLQFESR